MERSRVTNPRSIDLEPLNDCYYVADPNGRTVMSHLPFSHAAEKELLPECWDHTDHESNHQQRRDEGDLGRRYPAPLHAHRETRRRAISTSSHASLAEIIVGDAFGVDRMVRDSIGVAYGKLTQSPDRYPLAIWREPDQRSFSLRPVGVEAGGVESADLRSGRYSQVYFHRRIYDILNVLKEWLEGTLLDRFGSSVHQ